MPKYFHYFFIDEGIGELFNSGSMYMFSWEIGLDMKEVGPALNKSHCENRGKTDRTIKVVTTSHLDRKHLKYSSNINLK